MLSLLRNLFIAVFVLTAVAVAVRDLSGNVDEVTSEKPRAVATADEGDEDEDEDGADDRLGELEIEPGQYGQFRLEAEVNGELVDFLVDTGASVVVLGSETAERLGFDLDALEYSGMAQTANGTAPIARIILDEIVIGDLTIETVEAAVIKKPMATSLLGMSFLARLGGYEVRNGRLVLRW